MQALSVVRGEDWFLMGRRPPARATITNHGPTALSGGVNAGQVVFGASATAGSATLTNGGSGLTKEPGASTLFINTSDAGNATITNSGGTANGTSGGSTNFEYTTTGKNATINNNAGAVAGALGGLTSFGDSTTAGSATITNAGTSRRARALEA